MKQDSKQEDSLTPDEDPSPLEPKPEKRGWGRSITRICVVLLLSFVFLIAAAGIVLEYYFPSETHRQARVVANPQDASRYSTH